MEGKALTTEDALLAAIRDHPDEDTPRLEYADWLQENDDPVTCPECSGKGARQSGYVRCDVRGIHDSRTSTPCPRCGGPGRVPGECTDLAELIRVQCELATNPTRVCGRVMSADRMHYLERRELELLAAHPEWSRCECDWCGGTGQERVADAAGDMDDYLCRVCGGTGDLFRLQKTNHRECLDARFFRKLTWDRGFVGGVELLANECWREEPCPRCNGRGVLTTGRECPKCGTDMVTGRTVPTPLLLALLRRVPTLRWVVTELKPTREEGGWEWYGLPDTMNVPETKRTFDTQAAAEYALAAYIPKWALLHKEKR